jgi:high-affinity K+ transport system ATPase subunit B
VPTEIQAVTTIADAASVMVPCARPSHASAPPALAAATAGNANGSTQHTPQATAPAAVVRAATDADGREIRKGAADAIERYVTEHAGHVSEELRTAVQRVARSGGTPLVVADHAQPLGVIHLKDVVKGGIRERFAHLRAMGIRTVMITGDNPLTAAAIAAEAGVDDRGSRPGQR